MFDLDPGPDFGEPLPTDIVSWQPGAFAAMAGDYVDGRAGSDAQLAGMQSDVIEDGVPDIDGAAGYILGPAEDAHDTNANDTTLSAIPELEANGDHVNARAAEVQDFLPNADSSVPLDFTDPPTLDLGAYVDQGSFWQQHQSRLDDERG